MKFGYDNARRRIIKKYGKLFVVVYGGSGLFCFVSGLGYALFCFVSPSLWAVGLLALFGPYMGFCIYSVCGIALHVPLCHSQVFPGNFSPHFFCLFC